MTQVNKAAGGSVHQQHAEVVKFRSSLEALMVAGREFLGNPSLEDSQAVAFTTLTEDVLEPAGLDEELKKIDGVADPASKIELIMQDIIQPQLTTVAKLEEHLAQKAEGQVDEPFTTRDQMTAAPSFESIVVERDELRLFSHGLHSLKVMASLEGVTADHMRPMLSHFLRQVPDITAQLNISIENMEETQVLGEMTEAVDRMTAVVENARTLAETQVNDARGQNAQIETDNATDWTENLLAKVESTKQSGAVLDEDVKVSSTPSDGTVASTDTTGSTDMEVDETGIDGGDAGEAEALAADAAVADADAAAAEVDANTDTGAGTGDDAGKSLGENADELKDNVEEPELDDDGNPIVKEEEQEEEEEEEVK